MEDVYNKLWSIKLMQEANFSLLSSIAVAVKLPNSIIDINKAKMDRAKEIFLEKD